MEAFPSNMLYLVGISKGFSGGIVYVVMEMSPPVPSDYQLAVHRVPQAADAQQHILETPIINCNICNLRKDLSCKSGQITINHSCF